VRLSIDGTGRQGTPARIGRAHNRRVRIVENNAQFVVLEVTCACGG